MSCLKIGDIGFMISNRLTIDCLPKLSSAYLWDTPRKRSGYQVYYPSDNKVFVVRGGYLLERDSLFSKETVGVI